MDNRVVVHYYEFDKTSQIIVEKAGHTSTINLDSSIELLASNAVTLAIQNGISDIYVLGAPTSFQGEFMSNIEESQKLLHSYNNLNVRFA